MLKNIKLISNILFKPIVVKPLPLHLQLEITDACNLRCITCSRDQIIENPKIMSFGKFKEIYDNIKPQKINISGLGEPFINKDIFRMSAYANKKGSAVNLATNFTLAGRYMDEIVSSGIDQLKVSIDAANRDTYLKIRKQDKFEEITSSIEKLNYLKNKAGVAKPEIRFNFALQKDNIDELTDVINLASKLKIRSIYIQYLEYIDMEERKPYIVGKLNKNTLREHLIVAENLAKAKKINTNISIWLKDLELYSNKMEPVDKFIPNMRTCYFPWFSTFVEVNGDVKPCPIFAWKRNEGKMGNIFEEKFEDIWNNDAYRELRTAFRKGQRPFNPCKTCIPQKVLNMFYVSSKMLPTRQKGE